MNSIINAFTVTFDQINAAYLNKNITFFEKSLTNTKCFDSVVNATCIIKVLLLSTSI